MSIEVVPSVMNMSSKSGKGIDEILSSAVICFKKKRNKGDYF